MAEEAGKAFRKSFFGEKMLIFVEDILKR